MAAEDTHRILSMDGGGVMSLLTLYLIERIENERPGFLSCVDVFAGNSAGGINAILMAAQKSPMDALDDCLSIWNGTIPIYQTSFLRKLASLGGLVAMDSNSILKAYLEQQLGEKVMGDLHKRVVIPTFNVSGGRSHRNWKPRVFHNFHAGEQASAHRRQLCVDVALRTSAFPISFPIHQGYIDGGLYANDPGMCAMVMIIKEAREGHPGARPLPSVRMLSIGTGDKQMVLNVYDADWGWGQWFFDPKQPLLFVDAVYDCVARAVQYQCGQILGSQNYYRLNPPVSDSNPPSREYSDLQARIEQLNLEMQKTALDADLTETLAFLDRAHWIRPAETRADSTPAPHRPATRTRKRASAKKSK